VTRRLVLGTAGHIDHGKTALVRALTGVDTDRLPEEKRRGITIDLGFARLELPGGIELGIVDVPGHEAFVRNMLAGATGIDLMLLVVAADEGVMPQTREHLAIIELLGIRRGVVALTKADLADDEWTALVNDEVRELLAPTPLAGVSIVAVSARTGAGLDELRDRLADAAGAGVSRSADDLFRMPIDRVFTIRGTGTVVTGTVWSGALRRDAQLRIEPAGFTARVRALQHHGADCDEIRAGERAAVALAGIDRHTLTRGDCLVSAGWTPSRILTVELVALRDAAAPLTVRQRVRVHLGTGEVLARLALPDGEVLPGATGLAQLRLEQPLLCRAGDRFVIRSYSPVHTIAGGVVLEPCAPKRKRLTEPLRATLLALRDPDLRLAALLELAGRQGIRRADLPVLSGLPPGRAAALAAGDPNVAVVDDRLVAASHLGHCRDALLRRLDEFHGASPLEEGIDREVLRRYVAAGTGAPIFDLVFQDLLSNGAISASGSTVARAGFQPTPTAVEQALLDRICALLDASGLEPPELHELPPELAGRADLPVLVRLLERTGRIVRLAPTRWASATAISTAVSALQTYMVPGQSYGIVDFKDILGLTRKHLIPLLEYLDRTGVTTRTGETRILETPVAPTATAAQSAVAAHGRVAEP
jgi:selenocysteine-specific elongation factor